MIWKIKGECGNWKGGKENFKWNFKIKKNKCYIFFIMLCSTAISILHQAIPKIVENIGYLTFGTLSTCLTIFNCLLIKKHLKKVLTTSKKCSILIMWWGKSLIDYFIWEKALNNLHNEEVFTLFNVNKFREV